jgi:glucarate dehydratase
MRERLLGLDVRDLNNAERRCVPSMRYTPWGNIIAAKRAFGGIEMALWDARARLEGVPLHMLLGGAVRTEIGVTEYFSYRLPGKSEPGEQSPLEAARYCARMIEEHDSDGFEGKVATVALGEEIEMLREVRAAIGDRMLRLDANGAWSVPTARDALARMDRFSIHYYEDPVETYEEMADLRSATRASFATHVIDLPKAVRLRAPDAIVTNINEHGGIKRTVDFIRACEQFDVAFRFHAGETGIGTAAYLQLSAAMEHVREPSQTIVRWYADDVIEGGPFSPKRGIMQVPTGPGLGVTLDPNAFKRCHERFLEEGSFPAGSKSEHYGGAFRKR